jgi:hypothetical protein
MNPSTALRLEPPQNISPRRREVWMNHIPMSRPGETYALDIAGSRIPRVRINTLNGCDQISKSPKIIIHIDVTRVMD